VATLLLIDDEPAVLEGLSLVLRKQPFHLLMATSASAGLKLLEENDVDVIVSDERMPGMSGTEFLALVCQRWPHIVRIILTGHASTEAAIRAVNQSKAFFFLQKPCNPTELMTTLHAALEHRRKTIKGLQLLADVQAHLAGMGGSAEAMVQTSPSLRLSPTEQASMTRRELEILSLLVTGQRTAAIAKSLYLSTHTIRNHLKTLFKKLGVHSQEALIRKVTPLK
jgi:DNA-binding NarL/FixJ family response regulator